MMEPDTPPTLVAPPTDVTLSTDVESGINISHVPSPSPSTDPLSLTNDAESETRLTKACSSAEPSLAVFDLARTLRDEGWSQQNLYNLFSAHLTSGDLASSDIDEKVGTAIRYSLDFISGYHARGHENQLFPTTLGGTAAGDDDAGGGGNVSPLTTDNLAIHTMMNGTVLGNGGGTAAVAPEDVECEAVSTPKDGRVTYATSVKKGRDQNPEFSCLSKIVCQGCLKREKIGEMQVLYGDERGVPKVMVGPHWPFCSFFTVPLILILTVITHIFVVTTISIWAVAVLWLLFVTTMIGLGCVSCRNPGLVEQCDKEECSEEGWIWNDRVKSMRPPGAIYSLEGDVVVRKYDHFCPWTGTAIGEWNYWWFKVFVINIHLLCYYAILMIIVLLIWFRED